MARHHSKSMFLTLPMAAPAAFVFRNRAVGPEAALQGRGGMGKALPPEVPSGRSPGPRYQSPQDWPGLPLRGSWGKARPPYPPNLSTMALRFCARGPRGRTGADTLRSGAFSFFFSCEGGGSVGLWGAWLGEDSLWGWQREV